MASRDLSPEFFEYRRRRHAFSVPEPKSDTGGLLDDAATTPSSDSWRISLPPKWVDAVDQIEDDLRELDQKMEVLVGLHTKRLMVTFDDSELRHEHEIDVTSNAVTSLFRRSEATLKQVVAASGSGDGHEERVRTNIQRSLAVRLQERNTKFRALQKDFMRRLQQQKNGGTAVPNDLDFLTEEQSRRSQTIRVGFNQQQLQVVEDMEQIAAERDAEITKITQSIEEISQIFKELAVLVIDQGTILDRIDFNMEQVVEHTKEGVAQLTKAQEYQKSARPLKCIAFLLCMITVMLTMLVLKHTRKSSS